MATLVSEMPPLHTAEALAGVQAPANSSQPPPSVVAGSGGGNGGGGGGGGSSIGGSSGNVIDSAQSSSDPSSEATGATPTQTSTANTNNTISAAADSSDNQPSTPQPHLSNGNSSGGSADPQVHHQHHTSSTSSSASAIPHHPYANHHMYATQQPTTTTASSSSSSSVAMNHMYPHNIYASSNMDMQQQQQQQQQQPQTPTQHSGGYPSYLNSYEQFYQQQQQQQQQQHPSSQMDYINSNSQSSMYPAADYKQQVAGVRYHPYLHTPTSGLPSAAGQNSNSNNALDAVNSQSAPVVSSASSSVMSPRVVSSTSPSSSSNQMQMSGSASSIGSMSAGNPSSPSSGGTPQCKKCGIMCTNDSELQEHIANVHGASPYASSGYASSPYVKEELQQQTPPSQTQQQQQQPPQQSVAGGNPGEILDLDSQKMLYPPGQAVMPGMMQHPSVGVTDPLQSMHSMQQRAGMATWDQQSTEGLPPYLQQQNSNEPKSMPNHSPYYQSPKQSPYHVSNSTNVIKSEYPIIKSEYSSDTQQYMTDKSFDPTAPGSQQMMPPAVSSSPAEFPSTTTGGPQDVQQQGNQQFRGANFEPPTSSSVLSTNLGTKAANWKSNEARRPKTYNCTACNKWFTSSGHLKRHYNTTLHKNAVKSSGQPDPATLPISVHHHPARDNVAKASRRGGAAAAAAAAANAAAQQQQQPPNPVQPPEPPNSPPDYGGPQTAAGGLAPMSHYAATPSPNSMYQQQQQQQQQQQYQYMPQVQSTTNASPQHASTMAGAQQPSSHHQQQQQQQQTVMNGHPNALAGPSVPTTTQTMPMPSSQMRGLLNTTTTTTLIIKNEHMEAAMDEPDLQDPHLEDEEELGHMEHPQQPPQLSKQDFAKEELEHSMHSAMEEEEVADQEAPAPNVVHHLMQSQHQLHYQLDQQQADMERLYHNTTPSSTHSNMQVHSPLIISHQQYREQLQLDQQVVAQDTYTLTPTPPPQQQQQLHHNIMEPQPYINMPLAINTQQHSNMLQLQPQLITTEQQQPPPDTIIPTSMANMLPHSHHMPQQQQPTELQPLVNTQLQQQQPLDTINTNTQHMLPSHITTNSITSIPSYHQLQQPASVLQPLDHTLTYPHTIIGNTNGGPLPPINTLSNAELLTLDAYGNLVAATATGHQQLIQTTDGQLVQLIPTNGSTGATLYSQAYNPYIAQRSPQEGDLPPMSHNYNQESTTTMTVLPSMAYSPTMTATSTNSMEMEMKPTMTEDYLNNNYHAERQDVITPQTKLDADEAQQTPSQQQQQPQQQTKLETTSTATSKRKRNPSTSSSVGANSTMLPSGRIKCLPCDKEFTKICYLTQHNKCFHSGEYPFRCQKCGKRYQSEDVYITHLGKHKTTDKAHKCDMCPKQFHHKTDLRRHIEAIHTGNKQHSCDICDKSFCRKDHLRKHLETHNRPRLAAKKAGNTSKASGNRGGLSAFVRIEKKGQVDNSNSSLAGIESNQPTTSPPPPPTTTNQNPIPNQQLPKKTQAIRQLNDIQCESSSSPTPLTQQHQSQQLDDVAVDDDDLMDEELDDYDHPQDSHELDEEEYISIQEYERQIQQRQQQQQHLLDGVGQYLLSKQTYQIVEQEIPLY